MENLTKKETLTYRLRLDKSNEIEKEIIINTKLFKIVDNTLLLIPETSNSLDFLDTNNNGSVNILLSTVYDKYQNIFNVINKRESNIFSINLNTIDNGRINNMNVTFFEENLKEIEKRKQIVFEKFDELKEKYLNQKWKFDLNNRKSSLGVCDFKTNTISISKHFLYNENVTINELINTVIHEVAHAILPPKNKHNHLWKAVFEELGGNGKRTSNIILEKNNYKIIGTCPNCGANYYRQRRNKDACCSICYNEIGIYFKIKWEKNKDYYPVNMTG